jgi:hypothetical protein
VLRAASICHDCNVGYQARMVELDRCESPGTVFVTFESLLRDGTVDEETVGIRPTRDPSAPSRYRLYD